MPDREPNLAGFHADLSGHAPRDLVHVRLEGADGQAVLPGGLDDERLGRDVLDTHVVEVPLLHQVPARRDQLVARQAVAMQVEQNEVGVGRHRPCGDGRPVGARLHREREVARTEEPAMADRIGPPVDPDVVGLRLVVPEPDLLEEAAALR